MTDQITVDKIFPSHYIVLVFLHSFAFHTAVRFFSHTDWVVQYFFWVSFKNIENVFEALHVIQYIFVCSRFTSVNAFINIFAKEKCKVLQTLEFLPSIVRGFVVLILSAEIDFLEIATAVLLQLLYNNNCTLYFSCH